MFYRYKTAKCERGTNTVDGFYAKVLKQLYNMHQNCQI